MSETYWGPDFDALSAQDPEIAAVVVDELDRLRSGLQLIASENFTSPGRAGRARVDAEQQVRRGYPGGATTAAARWSTGPRSWASSGPRSCSGPITPTCSRTRGRTRTSRPTARSAAGRHRAGDVPAARRPPHPRQPRSASRASGSTRCTTACNPQTEDIDYDQVRALAAEHRPKMIICGGSADPAADRLRRLPRDRRRGRGAVDGGRRALHRPGRRQGHPVAGALCRRGHLHHPQGAAWPARWRVLILLQHYLVLREQTSSE